MSNLKMGFILVCIIIGLLIFVIADPSAERELFCLAFYALGMGGGVYIGGSK